MYYCVFISTVTYCCQKTGV